MALHTLGEKGSGNLPNQELELQLAEHAEELGMLSREADRRMVDLAHRRDAAATRAALLVSSAAIASGFQIAQDHDGWHLVAITASLAAALLAVPVMLFRKGREVGLDDKLQDLYSWSPRRLELEILNTKRKLLEEDESAFDSRATFLRAGFVALTTAIVFTGLQVAGVQLIVR